MTQEIEIAGFHIPQSDWDATPASVKALVTLLLSLLQQTQEQLAQSQQQVAELQEQQTRLQERLSHLEEQVKQNSQNSSRPPSSEGFGQKSKPAKEKSRRSRGGQPGHEGHGRHLYPLERCQAHFDHHPGVCGQCGHPLEGNDPTPYRHQIVDLPPIEPIVIEHRLHELECPHCGAKTRAKLPPEVSPSGYGERLTAVVALLSGVYRQSHQMLESWMQDLFNIPISVGRINGLRREMSESLAPCVEEAKPYVQQQAVRYCDETSFPQGNFDGNNPSGKRAWLWVVVTTGVIFFEILLSRATSAAQDFLGKVAGVVVSDRCGSYGWIGVNHRQICWAHLKRDFTAMAERSGASREFGLALLAIEKSVFEVWYQVRDGTLSRPGLQEAILPLRTELKRLLEEVASHPIGSREKTPWAKTVRTCRQLLLVEPALWTFVETKGVEPTNNAAEQALRPAVIWRKVSFGSQSQAGSHFVARMLTVTTSLKAQQRDVLEFLTQTCRAVRLGQTPPSLLPQVQTVKEAETLIAA